MNKLLLTILLLFSTNIIYAQVFRELGTLNIPALEYSSCAAGDIDSDGDLDIAFTGSGTLKTLIYINKGNNIFQKDTINDIPSVEHGDIDFIDYDNDGDLDLTIDGRRPNDYINSVPNVFQNDGSGKFTAQKNIYLRGVEFLDFAWGDCDNDGDLDLLTNTLLYINNNDQTFDQVSTSIKGGSSGSVDWADYDKDGDIDVLITGNNGWPDYSFSKIYINTGNYNFKPDTINNLEIIRFGTAKWADFDNDGFLDIFLAGYNDKIDQYTIRIYKNKQGKYEDTPNLNITGIEGSVSDIGDFDNDGLLDFAVSGTYGGQLRTRVFKNGGTSFIEQTQENIMGVSRGDIRFADLDADGDLDMLVTGSKLQNSKVYINHNTKRNTPPQAPVSLQSIVNSKSAILKWQPSLDAETPSKGLDYVVEVTKGLNNPVVSSTSYYLRRSLNDTALVLTGLEDGYHYWKVKAVDNSYLASPFSEIDSFYVGKNIPIIDHSPKYSVLSQEAGSIRIQVKNIGKGELKWQATVIGDWFTISSSVGSNNTDIIITYQQNEKTYRKGGIRLHSTNALNTNYYIEFVQKGNQVFTEVNDHGIVATDGASSWADFDNDGDLDLILTGNKSLYYSGEHSSQLYRNDLTSFSPVAISNLPKVMYSDVKWFDLNNDGRLDFIIGGHQADRTDVTAIFINQNGQTFQRLNQNFRGTHFSNFETGDVNNDGLPDVMITGEADYNSNLPNLPTLYMNEKDSLYESKNFKLDVKSPYFMNINFVDHDQDRDADIFISKVGLIKNNDGEWNYDSTKHFSTNYSQSSSWVDLNNDGFQDLFLYGKVYLNIGNNKFIEKEKDGIPASRAHSWGDYDNDGDIDLVTRYGFDEVGLYENQGDGSFRLNTNEKFPISQGTAINFVDYDKDGRLDLFITGCCGNTGQKYTKLYRNNFPTANAAPQPPALLQDSLSLETIFLSWSTGNDLETQKEGLYYNVEMHNTNGEVILLPEADINTGQLKSTRLGNVGSGKRWKINLKEPGNYKWKVQSIDPGLKGSVFSEEKEFSAIRKLMLREPLNAQLQAGHKYKILWESAFVDSVFIELISSTNRLKISQVASKPMSYEWSIPFDFKPGIYYLKIIDIKYGLADSTKITIMPGLEIISPNDLSHVKVDTTLKISWKSVNIDSVKIEYSGDKGLTWNLIERTIVDTNSYNWQVPFIEAKFYTIKVSDIASLSYDTVVIKVLENPLFGKKEIKPNIYPNPFSGRITIKVPQEINVENIQVYSLDGLLLIQATNLKNVEDYLIKVKDGLYFILFVCDKKFITIKVLKK